MFSSSIFCHLNVGGEKQILELTTGQLTLMDATTNAVKKSIPLDGCVVNLFMKTSFLLRTAAKSYVFDSTAEEAQSWVETLTIQIVRANEAVANVRALPSLSPSSAFYHSYHSHSRTVIGCV